MNPKPLRQVDLFSSAGRLEALYRELQDPSGTAVICHPHPLGGGTLHNKVVFRAARGLENANIATLRFNFRGTGLSGGKHDQGEGEQDDVMAAIDWAAKQHAGLPLLVGGFSFGGWVASRVACELPNVAGVFLIGTPIQKYDFGYLKRCDKPVLLLHGTQDEFGDVPRLEKLAQEMKNAQSVIVTGADHFFTQQLEAVEETMRSWALEILEESAGK